MATLTTQLLALTTVAFGLVCGRHIRDANMVCNTEVCNGSTNALMNSMDTSVDPCTDFYGFVCGNYIKTNPIPGDKTSYGVFTAAADRLTQQMKAILENDTDDNIPEMVKVKRMYQACLVAGDAIDAVRTEVLKLGGAPLFTGLPWNPESFDTLANLGYMYHIGMSPIISVEVTYDQKVPLTNVINIDEGDLVTDRDYFLLEGYENVLEDYKSYIENTSQVMLPDEPEDKMAMIDDMIIFEGRLANLTMTPLERQNSTSLYNRMTVEDLQVMTDPKKEFVDWVAFLKSAMKVDDITEKEPVIVSKVEYAVKVIELLKETDKRTIANYIVWTYINGAADEAFGVLREVKFGFLTALGGANKEQERYKKCITTVEGAFGFVIGRAYVQRYFSEADKKEADEMIETLQNAFVERLKSVTFMDEDTKAIAADKAKNMKRLIGFPDWIMDDVALIDYYRLYPDMTKSHFMNAVEAAEVASHIEFQKLREKIDPERFLQTPTTVNAGYLATVNAITIPAAILQPPFYQAGLPGANNFGAIGAIIGHEITHGFDNDGRKFDKFGSMKDWWPQSVVDKFEEETACFIDQYKSYCEAGLIKSNSNITICVNGETTLGENIADNGGLEEAYQAWKLYMKKNGPDYQLPGMKNFTWDQIFYISFGNVWCESYTPIGYQTQILTDEHSPEKYRVIGAVSNSPEFAAAFNCPEGKMNRGNERCTIW